jgi:hypothetical protein
MTTKQPKPKTREELEGKVPERDAQGNIILPEGWERFTEPGKGLSAQIRNNSDKWRWSDSWAGSPGWFQIRPKPPKYTLTVTPPPKPTKTQRDIAATEARLATLRDLDQAERDLAANKTKGGKLAKRVKELQAKLGAG